MVKAFKYLLFALVLATLWAPLGNDVFEYLKPWPLNGSFEVLQKPTFKWNEWWEGSYQPKEEAWLNQEMGGRTYLIRLRNQYYFSVFNMAMANGVSPCENGVLLDVGYVDAFYGKDFAGDQFLTDKLVRWKRVQHGLDSIGVKAFMATGKRKLF